MLFQMWWMSAALLAAETDTRPVRPVPASLLVETLEDTGKDAVLGVVVLSDGDPGREKAAEALQDQLRRALVLEPGIGQTRTFKDRSELAEWSPVEAAKQAAQEGCTAVLVGVVSEDGVRLQTFNAQGAVVQTVQRRGVPTVTAGTVAKDAPGPAPRVERDSEAVRAFERRALTAHILSLKWAGGATDVVPMVVDHRGFLVSEDELLNVAAPGDARDTLETWLFRTRLATGLRVSASVLWGASWLVPIVGPVLMIPFVFGFTLAASLLTLSRPDLRESFATIAHDHNMGVARDQGLDPAVLPGKYFNLRKSRRVNE